MTQTAQLVIENDKGDRQTFALEGGPNWNLGRGQTNHVVLPDNAASRLHAVLQRTELDEYYLLDAGSRNGTFIGERRLGTPMLLKQTDVISIGVHRLTFLNPQGAGESALSTVWGLSRSTQAIFAAQLVTVAVLDILDFTRLSRQVTPELLSRFLSSWFSDASKIFRAHGSWALKYIGDAVMGLWLHKPGDDYPGQVKSVLEAVAEFAALSSAARYDLPTPLSFHAGLNSGVASIGNAAPADQTDFTAFGDVVNAAFRIEASTREVGAEVAIGRPTADLLGAGARLRGGLREETISVKGYDDPIRIWAGSFEELRGLCE